MKCATIEQLFGLTQNQLPPAEGEAVRAHLDAGCASCRQELSQLQATLATTKGRHLLKVPDWLIHQAMNLFAWQKTKPLEIRLERIPALLLVDSFAEGPLLGFRSVGSLSRQMVYRAGAYNVNLSINSAEQTHAVDIMGQPMPLSADVGMLAGAEVELVQHRMGEWEKGSVGERESKSAPSPLHPFTPSPTLSLCTTKSNEFGAFILTRIPEGVYDLRIKLTEAELDVIGLHAVMRPH